MYTVKTVWALAAELKLIGKESNIFNCHDNYEEFFKEKGDAEPNE